MVWVGAGGCLQGVSSRSGRCLPSAGRPGVQQRVPYPWRVSVMPPRPCSGVCHMEAGVSEAELCTLRAKPHGKAGGGCLEMPTFAHSSLSNLEGNSKAEIILMVRARKGSHVPYVQGMERPCLFVYSLDLNPWIISSVFQLMCVSMYMCVHACACLSVSLCACVCIHVCMCAHGHTCMCVHVCVCIRACHMHAHVCMCP